MPRSTPLRLLLAVVLVVAVLLAALLSQRDVLLVATGWTAKRTCSGAFVARRHADSLPEVLLPLPLPIELPLSIEIHRAAGRESVTARFAGVFAPSVARYRAGLGCTLEGQGELASPLDGFPADRFAAEIPARPLRDSKPPLELAAAIDWAFERSDEEKAQQLGTRAVVVLRGGKVIGERYAKGFSARTRLPGWSMGKSVTATLVGLLADAGRLDPMAPVGLVEWSGADDPRRNITWDQLLRMSSGLEFDENYADPNSHAVRMLFGSESYAKGAYAAAQALEYPIDTHWSYSSGTTNVLQYALLQRVFEGDVESYLDFPRRALFGPLEMSSAVLEPDASGVFVGSSFVYATARDWARFGLLYLNDGIANRKRVLSRDWIRYSATPTATNAEGTYGAHWWLNADPAEGTRRWPGVDANVMVASGFEGQGVAVVPNSDLVVVRLGLDRGDRLDMGELVKRIVASLGPAR